MTTDDPGVAALVARPRTLDFDPARASLPDLLTLCDCPWHPCSHNGPKRDWRFHLFGRWAIGPVAPNQRHAPRARGIWRRLGSVQAVAPRREEGSR